MKRVPALLLPTLCALTQACDNASSPGTADADVPLTPTTEDLYTVGAYDGEDWEILGDVSTVEFDASGNLHIFDEDAKRIVVVDREGRFLRTVGREGEGPGEFSAPQSFGIMGDGRLVVYDFPGSLHIFDREGGLLESTTLDFTKGLPGRLLLPLSEQRFVTRGGMRISSPGEESGDAPEDDHLRDIDLFALDGSGKEVLYRAWNLPPTEVDEEIDMKNEEGRQQISFSVNRMRAFVPGLHLGTLSDGRLAVVDSMGYRVKLIGMDGTVVGTIEREIEPEAVTEAIKEAERERRRESAAGTPSVRVSGAGGLFDDAGLGEQMAAMLAAQIETMVFADVIPVIADMAVDRDDVIWVARTGAGGDGLGPIDLLSADGEYLGTLPADGLQIPDAFGPDGLMAYMEAGELDVPIVRVIRLVSFGPN